MDAQQFAHCFAEAASTMRSHMEALCRLDSGIGDGDHGVTVARGFDAAEAAARTAIHSPAETLRAVGDAMSAAMGGAIGPIYGAYWQAAAGALDAGRPIGDALAEGAAAVMRVGMAKPGEKTAVDAMVPCAEAAQLSQALGLGEALARGARAAEEGAQATAGMQAKKGRARFLREKSLGFVDPGAASFALFMQAWAQAALALEKEERA